MLRFTFGQRSIWEDMMDAMTFVSGALISRERRGRRQGSSARIGLYLNQVCAAVLLLLLGPLMLAVAWLTWKRDGAPSFLAHYRVGYDGKLVRCLKFRTMYRNADQMV